MVSFRRFYECLQVRANEHKQVKKKKKKNKLVTNLLLLNVKDTKT